LFLSIPACFRLLFYSFLQFIKTQAFHKGIDKEIMLRMSKPKDLKNEAHLVKLNILKK